MAFKLSIVFAAHILPLLVIASEMPAQLSPVQIVVWSAVVSGIAGWAAGWRISHRWQDWAMTACNTAVLGVCLCLSSAYWTMQSPVLAWTAVGLSGITSLAGLAGVDWAFALLKKKVEEKVDNANSKTDSNGKPSKEI